MLTRTMAIFVPDLCDFEIPTYKQLFKLVSAFFNFVLLNFPNHTSKKKKKIIPHNLLETARYPRGRLHHNKPKAAA